jgi:hypothetical protein
MIGVAAMLLVLAGCSSASRPAPKAESGGPPSPPPAAAQRGYKHWLVIGIGAAVLTLIFLASR